MYESFLKHWYETKLRNHSYIDYFNKYENIAVYGCGIVGRTLFDELQNTGKIKTFIDRNARNLQNIFNNINVIELSEIQYMNNIDAIIVTPYHEFHTIKANLRKYTNVDIISIRDIMSEIMCEDSFIDFSNYLVDKNVQFHYFVRPTVNMIDNPSLYEMSIAYLTNPHHLFVREDGEYRYNLTQSLCHDIDYFNSEYFNALFKYVKAPLRNAGEEGSEGNFCDTTSKFLNIVNGHRFIPDYTGDYSNTIYVFGDCSAMGYIAEDSRTFINQLQIKINKSNINYGIRARASIINNSDRLISSIKELDLKSGDIIIQICFPTLNQKDFSYRFFKGLSNIFEHDLSHAFSRPHEMGEVFLDSQHIIHRGYTLIANAIFDTLFCQKKEQSKPIAAAFNKQKKLSKVNSEKSNKIKESSTLNLSHELKNYLEYLNGEKVNCENAGAVVVNCNPFTNGHLYLIETISKQVGFLYIFVVEEDMSFFPYIDRLRLVREGTNHLKNVKILRSGSFIISSVTFPGYFNKEDMPFVEIDATNDLELFAKHIAPTLGIKIRFAGSEPLCNITKQYNRDMYNILPKYGIKFCEIARENFRDKPISASRVRTLLKEGNFDEIEQIVPQTTYKYLMSYITDKAHQ